LQTAKLKAAYKCELLLKQFMPKAAARRKSDTAKTIKTPAKAEAKTASKKRAVKKPASQKRGK